MRTAKVPKGGCIKSKEKGRVLGGTGSAAGPPAPPLTSDRNYKVGIITWSTPQGRCEDPNEPTQAKQEHRKHSINSSRVVRKTTSLGCKMAAQRGTQSVGLGALSCPGNLSSDLEFMGLSKLTQPVRGKVRIWTYAVRLGSPWLYP